MAPSRRRRQTKRSTPYESHPDEAINRQSSVQSTIATPALPPGRYPELLTWAGDQRLRIGVDFGTANTCASFVVLSSTEDGIFDYVKNIEALHARNEQIRFPTVMAILPTKGRSDHARVVFATDAIDALADGKINNDHLIVYSKLGLVTDLEGVVEIDRDVLSSIQARHKIALNIANSFRTLTVRYPGKDEEEIILTEIDDVIIACLKYFLGLLKVSIAGKLEVTDDQLSQIFDRKTEVGFAAPAFWTDSMLDRFLHLIQMAGWPSYCRIWSEPKCALAAHVALKLAASPQHSRAKLWDQGVKAVVMVDVGSGTTDLASIKPKRMNDKTIEFESIAESTGSLCGARLLDFNIESRMRNLLAHNLTDIRKAVSDNPEDPIGEEEFFQSFDFEECRKNFDGSKEEYTIRYRGNNLPSGTYNGMTPRAIELSQDDMVASHDSHARRVIEHVVDQIQRTREAMIHDEDLDIEVLLVGGVTRSKFFSEMIQKHFKGWDSVTVPGSVEDFQRPLVAIGCILCLGQPTIGRRFRVREAYGVPIAEAFDSKKHNPASQARREDATEGYDVRDLMDFIARVGDFSDKKVDTYDWSLSLYKDDGTPWKKDPRHDPSVYPLIVKQDIFSTTDEYWGRQQHFPYKDVPAIKLRKVCEISLSQEECLALSGKYVGVGFWRNPRNGHWSFKVPVRITLQWLDVRASWTAEIPQRGYLSDEGDDPVWSKEIRFATVDHHGLKVGDKESKKRVGQGTVPQSWEDMELDDLVSSN